MPTVSKLAATLLGALAFAQGAAAFTISDIRVEGISRTEPGTVFSHLPFRAGDEYTAEKGTRAIHALYASGLFHDVHDENVAVLRQDRKSVV